MWANPLAAINLFIETGGVVLWGILAVSFLLWTLILERYWYIRWTYPRQTKRWVKDWRSRDDLASWYAHRVRELMISQASQRLNQNIRVINVLIAVCPLFGLLGTVTGMIQVFDVMAVDGSSNARAMASGVSAATVPTMAGMVVALSGIYFGSRLKRIAALETNRLADSLRFRSEVS